jgi:hypothetical protein
MQILNDTTSGTEKHEPLTWFAAMPTDLQILIFCNAFSDGSGPPFQKLTMKVIINLPYIR